MKNDIFKKPLPFAIMYLLMAATTQVFCLRATADENMKSSLNSQKEPLLLSSPKETAITNGEQIKIDILHPLLGRLAYSFTSGGRDMDTSLALLSTSLESNKKLDANSEVTEYLGSKWAPYHSQDVIFDPLFSPDGRYLLFKFGEPWNMENRYLLYVLDTKTNSTKSRLRSAISYESVSWSPDGNYIAFVEGGDREGNTTFLIDQYIGPLRLRLWNWRTGEEHLVVENDSIRGPFSWSPPHNLFYSLLDRRGKVQSQSSEIRRPYIYQYSVENRHSTLVEKDGYLPTVSPDGQSVAFFGSVDELNTAPLRSDWQYSSSGMALIVMNGDKKERIPLERVEGRYPKVCWLPDSQHLLTIQQIADSPNAIAEIKEWDVQTKLSRKVGILRAKDYKSVRMPITSPKFLPVNVSQDGRSLFIWVREWTKKGDNNSSVGNFTLQSVDLQSGLATPILQTQKVSADWHEGSSQ